MGYWDGQWTLGNFFKDAVDLPRFGSLLRDRREELAISKGIHYGEDYNGFVSGTPYYAIGDGTVSYSGWQKGYGNTLIVLLDRPKDVNGDPVGPKIYFLYGHQDRVPPVKLPYDIR